MMKNRIPSLDDFIYESSQSFVSVKFNSHTKHNPDCDIIEGHLDKDSVITYGIYVQGPNKGKEFMEYYSGNNYKPESLKKSNSRHYEVDNIPIKYLQKWEELKDLYQTTYKEK